jgi:putative hydrolase of the HAD superfamily
MIKAVVFDADGVLINAELFSLQLEREYGIPTERVLPFFTGIFQQCLIGKAELKTAIKPHLNEWGWKGSVDELLEFWFRSEHKIDEEMIDAVKSLKDKVPVFMATNQEQCRVNYMTNEMGFGEVFTKIYSSAGIGHLKANPKFFECMLEDLSKNFIPDIQPQDHGVQGILFSGINDFKEKILELEL